ncbi:MAG: hypothetical protein Q9163_004176 [Psora crenata]
MASGETIVRNALNQLRSTLSAEDIRFCTDASLEDVRREARRLEREQASRGDKLFMRRIEPLCRTLDSYAGIIELAGNYTKIMDNILQAFSDVLPRVDRLRATFEDNKNLNEVLGLIYSDILEFFRRAYKFFRRKAWHFWFSFDWGLFERRFKLILEKLSSHCDLLDKEAATIQFFYKFFDRTKCASFNLSMASSTSAYEFKKRKRGLDLSEITDLFRVEPEDYETAWHKVKLCILDMEYHLRPKFPSLAPSTLNIADAFIIFNLHKVKDVLWDGHKEIALPKYLSDNIDRIMAVTSHATQMNEAFSRTIIDQILVSAIYEEMQPQVDQERASQPLDPAVLELQHETPFQRPITYKGQARLLTGYADYTICYTPQEGLNLATNLIIIEAKKVGYTDTCLGQLAACMGVVYASRKDENKQNAVVYGIASDGLTFRFSRIDNDGGWCQSRLMERDTGDMTKIYSIFRSLIKIAALSSPSTSPSKNPQQKGQTLAAFSNPDHARHFDYVLSSLVMLEEDDETEIVSLRGSRP